MSNDTWTIKTISQHQNGPLEVTYGVFIDKTETLNRLQHILEPYGIDVETLDPIIEAKTYTYTRVDRNLKVVVNRKRYN